MKEASRAGQLKNRSNFVCDGRLFLVKCMACPEAGGRENWAIVVSKGLCAHCGWIDKESIDE